MALLSSVDVAFLAFAIYAIASHYGVIKDPGWTLRPTEGNGERGLRRANWTPKAENSFRCGIDRIANDLRIL